MGPGSVGQADGAIGAIEPTVDERVFAEQVRLVYRSTLPLAVNLIIAAIVSAVLWPTVGAVAAGWAAAMATVIAARMMLRARFLAQPPALNTSAWARYYVVGAGLTGALWGATAVAVVLIDSAVHHMFIGLAVAGMGAGAVAALSFYLPSFYVFIGPALVPVIYAFARAGEPAYLGIAAMGIVFAAAMTGLARSFNAALTEALRLRFANADLARELTVAQDIAEAARRSSWEIVAHISHELRTPLNAISGFAEVIHKQLFGALGNRKYEEYARDIAESAGHLVGLVDQILSYSKGRGESLALDETAVDPAAEIDVCVQMHAGAARHGGVELVRDLPGDLPTLRADAVKLRQILVNLLSNAVKFTPPGGRITVSATRTDDGGLAITVADTGIGIRAEDLRRVVEPYVQIENVLTRTRSGLGLGLPLAKQLVGLHGGEFTLASEVGVGTQATIRFPASRCGAAAGDRLRRLTKSENDASVHPIGQ